MEKVVKKRGRPKAQPKEEVVTGGKIQEIIDSRQAPGMSIKSPEEKRMSKYMQDTNGLDPNTPLDWSKRRCTGADWSKNRPQDVVI